MARLEKDFSQIVRASKAHAKTAKDLAAAVSAQFPKGTRVQVPVGRAKAEGFVSGPPDISEPERVPVSLNSWRPYSRNIHYSHLEVVDDLFIKEAESG